MNLELDGKVALVTGASKGIGRAIARVLAGEGMKVAVAARSAAELDALTAQLGEGAMAFPCDLSDAGAPAAFAAAAMERHGRIDLVVNNAGNTVRGDFLNLTEADWQAGFALKFHGYRRMAAATWLELKRSSGTLINIIGVGARMGTSESTIVGAVNAALVNLTKALADKGVTDGVRVIAVMPGYIATDRWTGRVAREAAASGMTLEQAEQSMVRAARIARVGQPEEIGKLVTLLASPAASYVQGAIIDADGGLIRAL